LAQPVESGLILAFRPGNSSRAAGKALAKTWYGAVTERCYIVLAGPGPAGFVYGQGKKKPALFSKSRQ